MSLSLDGLRAAIEAGEIDEVAVALPDLHGRLQGSRIGARHFLAEVLEGGMGACTYLLAVDLDMRTGPGWGIDAERDGFGDLRLVPDASSLRRLPWAPGTAVVIADAVGEDGTRVDVAPRTVLRHQLDRLAERGLHPRVGLELEFLAFAHSHDDAASRRWHGLAPLSRHNSDYALVGLGELEALGREIRRTCAELGLEVESARGECHPGQYEIVFRHGDALRACDDHVLFKAAVKEVAAAREIAVTFMPKFDAGEGNGCHVHLSLRDPAGAPAFAGDGPGGRAPLLDAFLAGQLAAMPELALLFAPTVNAYKRLQPGAFAPVSASWGEDNRSAAVRVVGAGSSLRFEHRVPGADANPYLAVAGMIAAGLHGMDAGLVLPPACVGAPDPDDVPLPRTLDAARAAWLESPVARAAFGARVVAHLARAAQGELDVFRTHVTDLERARSFERA